MAEIESLHMSMEKHTPSMIPLRGLVGTAMQAWMANVPRQLALNCLRQDDQSNDAGTDGNHTSSCCFIKARNRLYRFVPKNHFHALNCSVLVGWQTIVSVLLCTHLNPSSKSNLCVFISQPITTVELLETPAMQ